MDWKIYICAGVSEYAPSSGRWGGVVFTSHSSVTVQFDRSPQWRSPVIVLLFPQPAPFPFLLAQALSQFCCHHLKVKKVTLSQLTSKITDSPLPSSRQLLGLILQGRLSVLSHSCYYADAQRMFNLWYKAILKNMTFDRKCIAWDVR